MSSIDVYKLDDYRDRRRQRLDVIRALHDPDPGRASLVTLLDDLARLLSADRAAVVWVDEYGPGLVHPHVVVDLLCDRPRRTFSREPLRAAWENGVPGAHEVTAPGTEVRSPWSLSLALGSDGTRSWFVMADAVSPRAPITSEMRDHALFLAGECASVVLHRDFPSESTGSSSATAFTGGAILKDLESRDADSAEGRAISLRFIVGRLPALLLEDDLAVPADRLAAQAGRAREEIAGHVPEDGDGEATHWTAALDAYASGDFDRLGPILVDWAQDVEAKGHRHGAVELYRAGYEISSAVGDVESAVEAARLAGRCLRRASEWKSAHGRYEAARKVADVAGMPGRVALVLDGVATIHRERGNLPAARDTLVLGLETAQASGDRDVVGRIHHGLMGLEQNAGNLDAAVDHGLRAVRSYGDENDRMRGLAGLAGVLQDQGALDAAAEAWEIVGHVMDDGYYRLYAKDALSHIAALQGDRARFARFAAEVDAMGWEAGPDNAKAEILLYRGLSYLALGENAAARDWLKRTVSFAEERSFSRVLFRAEDALERLSNVTDVGPTPSLPTSYEVGSELRALRRELVGAPA